MKRERFEKLVAEAVEELPEEFLEKLENIDVVVESLPSAAQLRNSGLGKDYTLLGLYEGVPLTERHSNYGLVPPDKITIFQKTIEEECGSAGDFKLSDTKLLIISVLEMNGSRRLKTCNKQNLLLIYYNVKYGLIFSRN